MRTLTTVLTSAVSVLALGFAITIIAPIAALAQEPDVYHPASEEHPTSGKQDFDNHCAPCHGLNGKGHGPELKMLPNIHPSNLTLITMKNGGVFPVKKIEDMVDGRKTIPSHKRFDMPFWGVNFQEPGKEFSAESEAKAKARIAALVAYIKSIQQK